MQSVLAVPGQPALHSSSDAAECMKNHPEESSRSAVPRHAVFCVSSERSQWNSSATTHCASTGDGDVVGDWETAMDTEWRKKRRGRVALIGATAARGSVRYCTPHCQSGVRGPTLPRTSTCKTPWNGAFSFVRGFFEKVRFRAQDDHSWFERLGYEPSEEAFKFRRGQYFWPQMKRGKCEIERLLDVIHQRENAFNIFSRAIVLCLCRMSACLASLCQTMPVSYSSVSWLELDQIP